MINLAKYTPIVETPDDENDIRIQALNYTPNQYDYLINKHTSIQEDYGSQEVNDKISKPQDEGFIFTDEMKKQLKIKLKDDSSPINGDTESTYQKSTFSVPESKRKAEFDKYYDEVEKINPEASRYRKFLTTMAMKESGFNPSIKNPNAPAYGYFQFMQDGSKYNNISHYSGVDINTFLNDPIKQIQAAINLAKSFEKGFSKEDMEAAKKRGISTWGLLGGAWLAGNGGVRTYLQGRSNPSDKHWDKKGGNGTSVEERIKIFNFKRGGKTTLENDNTRVAKIPIIDRTPIKRIYRPNEYTISQDNRSDWEKKVSAEKAKENYEEYMLAKENEKGLNNLIGFTNFVDLAGIGFGAGKILTKGVKYAGKKMLDKKFKSSLDWNPESWFKKAGWNDYTQKDIDALKSHIPEYLRIEEEVKRNGTWLVMPDGSKWTGDPRSWVQLMSKNGSKLVPERLFTGVSSDGRVSSFPEFNGRVWTSNSKEMADEWSKRMGMNGRTFEVSYPKDAVEYRVDAKGKSFHKIDNVDGLSVDGRKPVSPISTNDMADLSEANGYDVTRINNVVEIPGGLVDDIVIHKYVPRKSLIGNNGNFDFNNKNIYRMSPLSLLFDYDE